MDSRWNHFARLAKETRDSAAQAAALARGTASKAAEAALAASKVAMGTIAEKSEDVSRRLKPHLDQATSQASRHAEEFSVGAVARAKEIRERVGKSAIALDENHEEVATNVETVSMAAGIAAGIAADTAWIAAPTGLAAIAISFGIKSAPSVVGIAAVLGVVSMVAGFVSGVAYFYSMWRRKQTRRLLLAQADKRDV